MQVDQGVGVLVLLQQVVEELATGAEDGLVSQDLSTVTTDQGDITEVGIFEQAPEGFARKGVEVGSFESQPHVFHFIRLNELNEYNDFVQAELRGIHLSTYLIATRKVVLVCPRNKALGGTFVVVGTMFFFP